MILERFSLFDFKVVVYSSGLLEEQEKFDNKVVDLFSYKTYEGLSVGTRPLLLWRCRLYSYLFN